MFRAPLCPSSGAQDYYTVVAACGILCWFTSILQTGHITHSSTPDQQLEKHVLKLMFGSLRWEMRWLCEQHLLWDRQKPQNILVKLAGRSTFRMHTAIRRLNTNQNGAP